MRAAATTRMPPGGWGCAMFEGLGIGRRGAVRRPLAPGRWSPREAAAPEMVSVHADHLRLADGRVACTLAVRGYPREVEAGWLDGLFGLDGELRIGQHIEPLDQATALAELERDLRSAAASLLLADLRGGTGDALDGAAVADAKSLRETLARGEVRLFRHHLLITILADDLPDLGRRTEAVLAFLDGRLLLGRRCLLEQAAGFVATMPLGRCALRTPRNLDSDALAAALPFGAPEFQDAEGEWWGIDLRRRTAVTLNRYALPNPHGICVAGSGSGKSFWLKHLLVQNILAGRRAAVLDPQGEYGPWCRAVGGSAVRLGARSPMLLNPLARPVSGEVGPEAWPAVRAERVRAVLEVLAGPAIDPADVRSAVDLAAVHGGEPSLVALAEVLLHAGPAAQRAGRRLEQALQGGLRAFSGQGAAPPPRQTTAVAFDLRDVVGQSAEVAAAAYLLLTHHVLDHLVQADAPMLTLAVDEAHHLLAHAAGARFLEVLFRGGRKRGVAVCLATQSVGDLLGADAQPEAARAARAALANAAAAFLMRQQNGREVAWLRDLFRLDPQEAEWLLSCPPGHGLLLAGPRRALLRVEAPEELRAAFSTEPPGAGPRPP